MISNKEIDYVGDYPRKVPYPGDDYATEAMEKLALAHDIFKKKYDGKKYSLILSNGEEINMEIQRKQLAHLLGVDHKGMIQSDYMKQLIYSILGFQEGDKIDAYSLLSRIIDNGDAVIKNDKTNYNKFLNYYRLVIKTSCFEKFSDFTDFNFGVINFNKDLFHASTNKSFAPNSTKLLFSQNDEALIPYCMMGLVNDSYQKNIMVPETLIAPTDFENFLINQELLLPIQMLINDEENLSKNIATSEEKIRMLNLYKSLIQMYNTGSYINIFNDYESVLRETVTKKKVLK